ncbi:hypothetical protein NFI96_016580 [Prochilodus magdalenae]|nr:hypothetical protein NFI96_016580 [Prochilodus magdalenae]
MHIYAFSTPNVPDSTYQLINKHFQSYTFRASTFVGCPYQELNLSLMMTRSMTVRHDTIAVFGNVAMTYTESTSAEYLAYMVFCGGLGVHMQDYTNKTTVMTSHYLGKASSVMSLTFALVETKNECMKMIRLTSYQAGLCKSCFGGAYRTKLVTCEIHCTAPPHLNP